MLSPAKSLDYESKLPTRKHSEPRLLGQSDGLRVLRRLSPVVRRIAEGAAAASLDDVGGAAILADIASMRHETQYTRLFRS